VTVRTLVYADKQVESYDTADIESLREARVATGTTWIRASNATDDELDRLSAAFDLHTLEIEDVRSNVSPKVELFPDQTFVLVKTARLRGSETTFEEEIRDQSVGLSFRHDWIVTVAVEETSRSYTRSNVSTKRMAAGTSGACAWTGVMNTADRREDSMPRYLIVPLMPSRKPRPVGRGSVSASRRSR
jgi:Mg2+ and Co2+ transporter CorA